MERTKFLKYFLPSELIDNFDLVNIIELGNSENKEMQLFFDEKFNYPSGYTDKNLESKGFFEMVKMYDFPIQNKRVLLCLRKRRWVDKETKRTISKSYDFKHKGTSYSKDLASFLKDGVR